MSDTNTIVKSIGDAILLATRKMQTELKAYIDSQLGTFKFSGTQIRQNTLPGTALGQWGIPITKVNGLQAEVARIAAAEIDSAEIDYARIKNVLITTAVIEDGAITSAKIDDAAIVSAKIADAAVGRAQIASAAIGTANIEVGAITTALITEGAVQTAQIADGSITDAKIVDLTANKITAGQLDVERLVISGNDKSIIFAINNAGDLVSASVDTIDGGVITPRTITADRIVAESITSGEIASETIVANNISSNAITAGKIQSGAVTADKLDAGAVTAVKIDANAVTTEKLDSESVTAEKIKTGAISAGHLDANSIFSDNAEIKTLIASNLDAETFFSREAVINSLTLDRLKPLNEAITLRIRDDGIHTAPTAPEDPAINKLWLDTSVNPSIVRRWTGAGGWAAVNDIQIGGRNLIRGYEMSSPAKEAYLSGEPIDGSATGPSVTNIIMPSQTVLEQGVYTLSFDKKIGLNNSGQSRIRLSGIPSGDSGNLTSITYVDGGNSQNWQHIVYTFTINTAIRFGLQIYNHSFVTNPSTGNYYFDSEVYVKNIKIESGNKASEWSLAPEDVSALIKNVEIYKGSAAPLSPPIDKLWLDTSSTPEQIKRWNGSAWIVVSRSKTDNYINLGNVKMPDGSEVYGVAVGENVDVLDANGKITTAGRYMSVQTARAYKILSGGQEVFSADGTEAEANAFTGNKVSFKRGSERGIWIQDTTPTKGFVLKWGG